MTRISALFVLSLLHVDNVNAFLVPAQKLKSTAGTKVFSSLKEDPTKDKTKIDDSVNGATVDTDSLSEPSSEGLPWWWELVWKLDIMKKGEPGKEIIFGDSANVLR